MRSEADNILNVGCWYCKTSLNFFRCKTFLTWKIGNGANWLCAHFPKLLFCLLTLLLFKLFYFFVFFVVGYDKSSSTNSLSESQIFPSKWWNPNFPFYVLSKISNAWTFPDGWISWQKSILSRITSNQIKLSADFPSASKTFWTVPLVCFVLHLKSRKAMVQLRPQHKLPMAQFESHCSSK